MTDDFKKFQQPPASTDTNKVKDPGVSYGTSSDKQWSKMMNNQGNLHKEDLTRQTTTNPRDLVSHGTSSQKQWEKMMGGNDNRPPVGAPRAPMPPRPAAPATPPPPRPTSMTPPPAAPASAYTPPPTPPQPTAPATHTPSPNAPVQTTFTAQSQPAPQPMTPTQPMHQPATPTTTMAQPPQPAAPMTPPPVAPRPAAPVTPPPVAPRPAAPSFSSSAPAPTSAPSSAPATRTANSGRPRPQLSDTMFETYSNMIYDLSGMRFEKSKSYFLASKIDVRCQALGINGPEAYLTYLESPSGRAEYGHLIDEITINETFFYRHQPQLQAFQQEILHPMIFSRRQQRRDKIRIWSCAASTGDESYTTALMLKDSNLLDGISVEIVGTDICHDALQKARRGVYRKYAIRNVPPHLLQKYFTHDEATQTYALNDEIKQMVRFQECNLMDPQRMSALGKFDIAFCRNVLIYFDETSKEQVVQNIANNMAEDGVVLMGHSENIYGQRHILRMDKTRTASIAYVKAPPGTTKSRV